MKHLQTLSAASVLLLALSACTPASVDNAMMENDDGTEEMMIDDEDPSNDDDDMIDEETIEDAGGDGVSDVSRTVQITADNWTFSPNTITASVGEAVTLEITGAAGTHGFAIPDLDINESVAPGQTVSIELPTDTAGTFSFKCSIPCGGGHKTMVGTIVIE